MLPEEQEFKPTVAYPPNQDPNRPKTRYWMIDGHRQPRMNRDDATTKTTVQTRELMDVDARLRDMDAMGVETQIIYPTLFLVGITTNRTSTAVCVAAITAGYPTAATDLKAGFAGPAYRHTAILTRRLRK